MSLNSAKPKRKQIGASNESRVQIRFRARVCILENHPKRGD